MFMKENNRISPSDLMVALQCLGFPINSDKDLAKNELTRQEFQTLVDGMNRNSDLLSQNSIIGAFATLDPHTTGYVNANEMRQILMSSSENMSPEDINDFFVIFPPDSRGQIPYKIFIDKLFARRDD